MCYSELIKANNEGLWNWLTWETLCNPEPKFQKGDVAMAFGLWRADYTLLCQHGDSSNHADGGYGRGAIKIDVLPEFDYRPHKDLIKTFLPCMEIDSQTGKLIDPISKETVQNAVVGKYWVVMPYNYDDNSKKSRALGTRLLDIYSPVNKTIVLSRLTATLPRWSTASRSGIALMHPDINVNEIYQYKTNIHGTIDEDFWPFRPHLEENSNIFGKNILTSRGTTYTKILSSQNCTKFYSVKTGVQYVGKSDQSTNRKDILESNSFHAMKRSDLIEYVRKRYIDTSLKTHYQIEILCVQLKGTNPDLAKWDGFQVRAIDAKPDEVWFPALSIPSCGKAFAHAWSKDVDWVTFWKDNFAKPLGRAKAEMLAFFGLQHQTSNAQNMLIAFNKTQLGTPCKCIMLRDLGDTLLNDYAYDVLKGIDTRFTDAWKFEISTIDQGGITLTQGKIGGAYADPLMTRVGSTITFFSPPFQQGDLKQGAAKTLTTWGIALNESFLAYFQDEIGYTPSWQEGNGDGILPPKLLTDLKAYAADMRPTEKYKALKDTVLSLHSKQRLSLVMGIVQECNKLHANEPETARKLVGAHDMLIGAEVECYLKSDAGKKNLLALHKKYRREG